MSDKLIRINFNYLPPRVQNAVEILQLDKKPGPPWSHLTDEQKMPFLEEIANWLLRNIEKE